jgi:dihydroxyacetone kinase-like protein
MSTLIILSLLEAIQQELTTHEKEITELDKAIGDGDHMANLVRGLAAVRKIEDDLAQLDWSNALMKIGMTLMSTMGGASGSLYGTFFLAMSKQAKQSEMTLEGFAEIYGAGVESVKQRGKADLGEKTMLDTMIPVMNTLKQSVGHGLAINDTLTDIQSAAIKGMESTKEMLATKGRASFLGERAIGHIDAGARTSQLMICTIADVLKQN